MSLQWLSFPTVAVLLLLHCVLCQGIGAPRSLANIVSVQQGGQLNGTNSSSPNGSGVTPVTLADDGTYYIVLEAGLITFRATIDTGSADSWLISTACTTPTCMQVPRYPLQYDSPTFVSVNNNASVFNLSYADTTAASGFIAREAIQISNVTAPNQAIGLVTNSNVTLVDKISGILGLGFPRLSEIYASTANATPFFATLASQGILQYPIFGLSLTRNATGTLALGAIDVSVVQNVSNIIWNEVVPFSPIGTQTNTSGYFYWSIYMTGFSVNGTSLTPIPTYPTPTDNSSVALLDIGTPGIYGPYQDVTRFYGLIPGSRLVDESGQWVIPCTSSPTISFTFGDNNTFVLQPTDYIIGPAASNPGLCLSWPKALPPSSDGVDWQLGTPFLRTVYSVWSYGIDDEEPPMIGLYGLSNASATVESPTAVSAFLSSVSATVATVLPNYVLATPSYTTPPYTFNTSVPATFGEIVASELATSTYFPILASPTVNASALPKVYDAYTTIYTNSEGQSVTSTYHVSDPTTALGVPPGWSGAQALGIPYFGLSSSLFITVTTAVWILS
ncbi:acid protease [Pisolithus orientalis]|uniref:acid protease n=1 Tax=Pisolithus orientalis TaxID=936130 RepID=UPI00222508CD|nr:acid protease [Pisolithus orientalis]KAI5989635.1 acid protease [Pisolithus orientalis]